MLTKKSTLLGLRDMRSLKFAKQAAACFFFIYIKQVQLAKMWDGFSDFSEYLEKIVLEQIFICLFTPDF